jgi:tRNA1(Val) A37 N6-methylase TrmN6
MKVKNRLLNFTNTIIYQDDDYFLFSLDSVLLANFVTLKLTDKKIIDLCSGNGPVPMLMSFRTKARIFGVEIQKYIYDMGKLSIKENHMDKQIELINEDVNKLNKIYDAESFDVVTCNPPYFKYQQNSLINDNDGKSIARHEVLIKLEDILKISSYLLKNGGTFAMVHRPERLIEIINMMQKFGIEPKKMRFVYPKEGKNANMVLVEGVKNGKSNLKLLPPLIVHNEKGEYVPEIKKMFQEGE